MNNVTWTRYADSSNFEYWRGHGFAYNWTVLKATKDSLYTLTVEGEPTILGESADREKVFDIAERSDREMG